MNENSVAGVLSGAEIIKRGRREKELSRGGKVILQGLGPDVLAGVLEHLPDVTVMARLEKIEPNDVAKSPDIRGLLKAMNAVLLEGIISPKFFEDPAAGPTPRDLSFADQLMLFQEILDLSGFTQEAGGKVLPLSGTAG